jgi:hypothetical protein
LRARPGLKPHLIQTWKLSSDPELIAKVRDVVALTCATTPGCTWTCLAHATTTGASGGAIGTRRRQPPRG